MDSLAPETGVTGAHKSFHLLQIDVEGNPFFNPEVSERAQFFNASLSSDCSRPSGAFVRSAWETVKVYLMVH